jgi:hypothetical protein
MVSLLTPNSTLTLATFAYLRDAFHHSIFSVSSSYSHQTYKTSLEPIIPHCCPISSHAGANGRANGREFLVGEAIADGCGMGANPRQD